MKKFIIAVTALCCLAIAMPAAADVKISGTISTDFYWLSIDKELRAGGVAAGATTALDDRTEFQANIYRPQNYVQFTYTNKDATIGGRFRIRAGQDEIIQGAGADQFDIQQTQMWWKFAPNAKVTIGSQNHTFGGLGAPLGLLANNEGDAGVVIVGITYGNVHTSARVGAVLDYKFNDMIGMALGLFNPQDDGTPAIDGVGLPRIAALGGTAIEEIKIPEFNIGFPIKIGGLKLNPVGIYTTREFSQVGPNSEDSYDMWGVGIDAQYSFGPLTLKGEYKYGDNLGDANLSGGAVGGINATSYVDTSGVTRIEDAECTHWWLAAEYMMTKQLKIVALYGVSETENSVDPTTTADDRYTEQTGYGIGFRYMVTPNLHIHPQYLIFDRGDDNLNGTGVRIDNGKSQVIGVQFNLYF